LRCRTIRGRGGPSPVRPTFLVWVLGACIPAFCRRAAFSGWIHRRSFILASGAHCNDLYLGVLKLGSSLLALCRRRTCRPHPPRFYPLLAWDLVDARNSAGRGRCQAWRQARLSCLLQAWDIWRMREIISRRRRQTWRVWRLFDERRPQCNN